VLLFITTNQYFDMSRCCGFFSTTSYTTNPQQVYGIWAHAAADAGEVGQSFIHRNADSKSVI